MQIQYVPCIINTIGIIIVIFRNYNKFFLSLIFCSGPRHHSGRVLRRRRVARAGDAHQGAPSAARRGRPGGGASVTGATAARGRERTIAARRPADDDNVRSGLQACGRARRVRVHGPNQVRRVGPAVCAQAGGMEASRQGGQSSWLHSGRLTFGNTS